LKTNPQTPKAAKQKRNARPTKRQVLYMKNLAKGMSKREAAKKAGYSQTCADRPGQAIESKRGIQDNFIDLINRTIPAEKIAKTIKAGLEAKETKFAMLDGKITDHKDVIDYGERRAYAELAAKMGRRYLPGIGISGPDGGPVETSEGKILDRLFAELDGE
jgi:hypothetical protein